MKVLFITNIPAPYRIDFFNELGKHLEMTVVFEARRCNERKDFFYWNDNEKCHFNKIFLQENLTPQKPNFDIIKYIDNKYDVIILTNYYSSFTPMVAFFYCLIKKIKFIAEFDGGMLHKESKIKYFIKRFFIANTTALLSPSSKTDKYINHYGVKKEDIYRYHFTSIRQQDLSPYDELLKNKIRHQLDIDTSKVILYVGQFIYRKGIDVLLNVIPYLGSTKLVMLFVGGKPSQEYIDLLNRVNADKQCDVRFIPSSNKDDLKKYYICADIFVLPTREDIWGLVINEAMAYGLPVITTDKCVAGLEMIKDGENGFIVPNENIKVLAQKIRYLCENDVQRQQMGINNRTKIMDYTVENMASDHVQIISNFFKREHK